jgi:hypothetical protein
MECPSIDQKIILIIGIKNQKPALEADAIEYFEARHHF